MKTTILTVLGLGIALTAQAQIKFEKGTWAEVKAKAKKEKKMIFVDAYTTWCGPCKWLSANVFTDKSVGEYHNEKFVNFKLDMEQGEGKTFAQDFKVTAYPTLLYFTKEGELAHRLMGSMPADQFLASSKDATDPNKQFYTLMKKYEKGEKGKDFLRNLATAAAANDDPRAADIAKEALKDVPESDWAKDENLDLVAASVTDSKSKAFEFMRKNRDKFQEQTILTTLEKCISIDFKAAVEAKDEAAMKAIQAYVTELAPKQSAEANKNIAKAFYEKTGNTAKQEEITNQSESWNELNEKAWNYFQNETDKTKLETALGWAKRSVELNENFYNTDTCANLAYKLDRKEEALTWAEKALKLGTSSGEDTSATQALIKKIREGK